jgi:hypothetical protein
MAKKSWLLHRRGVESDVIVCRDMSKSVSYGLTGNIYCNTVALHYKIAVFHQVYSFPSKPALCPYIDHHRGFTLKYIRNKS